jgi:hypothetical protein
MMDRLRQAPMTFILSSIFGVPALLSSGAKVIAPSDSGEKFKRVRQPGSIYRASSKVASADH